MLASLPQPARVPSFIANAPETSRCAAIHDAAIDVQGIFSNSSSASDTWIVIFYDANTEAVVPAFMKIFIVSDGSANRRGKLGAHPEALGMLYESAIYSQITRVLVDRDVCPHFVYNYDSATNCSFDNLAALLAKSHAFDKAGDLRAKAAREALWRNVLIIASSIEDPDHTPHRPAVTAPNPSLEVTLQKISRRVAGADARNFRFGYIMNESVGTAPDLFDWMHQHPAAHGVALLTAFQVVFTCHAMALSLMLQSDLHLGNIYMIELGAPHIFEYRVDSRAADNRVAIFRVTTLFSPRIYDFDLSYAKRLGPNAYLEENYEHLCVDSNKCNKFVANKDALKFAMNFFQRMARIAGFRFKRGFASPRDEIRYAREFPLEELPLQIRQFAGAFARKAGDSSEVVRKKTDRLMTAFIRGNFLSSVAMFGDEYKDPYFDIGYRDLPDNLQIMANLAELIAAEQLPEPYAFSIGERETPADTVSVCTRNRFDRRTGELLF